MPAPVVHGHRGRTALLAVITVVVLAGVLLTWNVASSSDAAAAELTGVATAGPSGGTSVTIGAAESSSTAPASTSTTALADREPVVSAVETTVAVEAAVEPTVAPPTEVAVETPVEVASAGPAPAPASAPVSAPALVEVAPVNQSGCRTDMPRSVMTIEMPDIGYSCPVYAGGQSTIDAGAVTLITDQGSSPLLATHPGDTGTLWIAAHRTSHGGAFAAVPDLADGAIITVSDGSRTASYRVVGRAYVEARNGMVVDASGQPTDAATLDSVLRTDRGADLAPRLILQTCDGPTFRWMVYADLIG